MSYLASLLEIESNGIGSLLENGEENLSTKKKNKKKRFSKKKKKSSEKKIAVETEENMPIEEQIVIDPQNNLIFNSEEELYQHFKSEIDILESEFEKAYSPDNDISKEDFLDYEDLLLELLSDPDEIWQDKTKISDKPIMNYVRHFSIDDRDLYYIAVAYVVDDNPSFVLLHFPTLDESMLDHFRRGQQYYDRSKEIEIDALSEGDELATGLFQAMMTIRSEKDIPEAEFSDYLELRDETIEEADEIWRSDDFSGNTLVNFIKDYTEGDRELFYVAIAVEDKASDSHFLLFSFPSSDRSLVDRYRRGENLQTEEVEQTESH